MQSAQWIGPHCGSKKGFDFKLRAVPDGFDHDLAWILFAPEFMGIHWYVESAHKL
jgi:hypothetical protein